MQYKLEDEDTLMASNYVSRWLRAMQCDARLTFADKGFAGALALFATHETGRDCYPSNLRLSLMGDVTERSITRYRNKLVATGWIAIVRDGRGREATEVELTFPDASCYDLSLLTRKLDDETRQDCQVKPDTGVRFQNANLTNMSTQTRQDCQVKPDTGVTPPTHGPTQKPTQRERAGAQSRSVAHEQAREADALPSPSEQIGPEQQASELVTAEDASTVQAEVAPPVTGQALMGEGHSKASDTPELPEDMRRLRDELRAGREALAERDRHVASLPGPDVYLAELRELITVEHDLLWRSESAWHQLINNARRDGWTPAQLTERVHWCVVHYATARKAWRPQWLLSDVGRYDEGTAHVLNKAEAQHQRRVIESEGYLGQGQRRHAADLNDVGL